MPTARTCRPGAQPENTVPESHRLVHTNQPHEAESNIRYGPAAARCWLGIRVGPHRHTLSHLLIGGNRSIITPNIAVHQSTTLVAFPELFVFDRAHTVQHVQTTCMYVDLWANYRLSCFPFYTGRVCKRQQTTTKPTSTTTHSLLTGREPTGPLRATLVIRYCNRNVAHGDKVSRSSPSRAVAFAS